MSNKRTEVRQAVAEVLKNAFNDATVVSTRSKGLSQVEQMPAITVVTPNETATPESMSGKRYIRKIELRIEVRLDASEATDDALDNYLSEIEAVVSENPTFNTSQLILSTVLQATEVDVGYEGNKEIGLGILVYESTYVA